MKTAPEPPQLSNRRRMAILLPWNLPLLVFCFVGTSHLGEPWLNRWGFWLATACFLLGMVGHVRPGIESRRLRRRAESGACLHCGYDLTGSTSGRCPECGEAVEKTGSEAAT